MDILGGSGNPLVKSDHEALNGYLKTSFLEKFSFIALV